MFKNVYYGTSTNMIRMLAESGMKKEDLVPSKTQARAVANRQAEIDGGKPILLKVILDDAEHEDGKIRPNKILVCE